MRLFLSYPCFVLSLLLPDLCSCFFGSRDPLVRSVIGKCISDIANQKPNQTEQTRCRNTFRCIIDNVDSDYSARWSSGASILAFIPTIIALLSNSISEVSFIADSSVLLAVVLSFTSVTAFNYLLCNKTNISSDAIFTDSSLDSDPSQAAWARLENLILNSEKKGPVSWWRRRSEWRHLMCVVLFLLSALIWYALYETTKYGIVPWACPVKANVGIWAGLNQLLVLLNVVCRHGVFDIRTISFRSREVRLQTRHQETTPSLGTSGLQQPAAASTNESRGPSPTAIASGTGNDGPIVIPAKTESNGPTTISAKIGRDDLTAISTKIESDDLIALPIKLGGNGPTSIPVKKGSDGQSAIPTTPGSDNPTAIAPKRGKPFTLILRSLSNRNWGWLLRTFTTVASFALYTYGTVILASMTFIPASDAVRAMTILAVGAGFARLVGYWAMSPSETANQVITINVPSDCMEDFHNLVLEKARSG
ncbi:MAG: hypothetical protein Q9214_004350 [Letrouitia sp. 1 TL-2023]